MQYGLRLLRQIKPNCKMKKSIITTLILIFIVSIQSCSDDDSEGTTTQLVIGDFHEGGVIFYLDETGNHGLISSVADQGFNIEWGCPDAVEFGANGLEIGTGAQNTIDILDRCDTQNIAADLCDTYENDSFDDWFLPSKNELDALYQNYEIVNDTALDNAGDTFGNSQYWSSSHNAINTVWTQYFTSSGNTSSDFKNTEHYVRAIRSF